MQMTAGRSYALLDVLEVFFENLDGQTQVVTEIVERPLLGPQSLDDFLAAGVLHSSAFSANHLWIGTPSTYRSSITPTPSRIRTLT